MSEKIKFTSTVAGASIFLASMSLIGRGIGFLREILFANYFGLSQDFDIYLVGAVLPLTIDVIIFYVGQNFFIPTFHKIIDKDVDFKNKFLRTNIILFFGFGLIIASLLFFFSDIIIGVYLGNVEKEIVFKTSDIFNLFLITIPFTASISILSAYLQSEFNFLSPGLSRLFLNISIVVFVFLFTKTIGIYVIPLGYLVGTFWQFIYLIIKAKVKIVGDLFLSESISLFLKSSFIFTVLIEAISQLYLLSDRYFLKEVEQGGIAALNYAQTFFLLPISVVTLALSTAVLPKLSKYFTSGEYKTLGQTFNDGIRINLFFFVPLTYIFINYGSDLIQVIYQRGNFSQDNTLMTSDVLKYFAISFAFYSTYGITNKLMYSASLIKELMFITFVGILIKILFNFLLVKNFQQNGLAVSTSLSYIFFFLSSIFIIHYKNYIKRIIFIPELIFQVMNCVFSILFSIMLTSIFNFDVFNNYLQFLLFVAVYLSNQVILKTHSFKLVSSIINRWL